MKVVTVEEMHEQYKKDQWVSFDFLIGSGYVTGNCDAYLQIGNEYLCKKQVGIKFASEDDEDYVCLYHLSGMIERQDNGHHKAMPIATLIRVYPAGITRRELTFMETALNF